MRRIFVAVSLLAVCACLAPAKAIPGDAKRGSELIRTLGCVGCHKFGAEGGSSAPDLGRVKGRNYTPSLLASAMWNHAPAMWTSMEKQHATKPSMTEAQASDLFAYFHSIRYFDKPGDAARGRRVFVNSHCAECHARATPVGGDAPPVAMWKSLTSPIAFAQQMWNHAPQMEGAMAARKIKWQRLTADELTDLLVYVQNLPETRGREREFSLASTGKGEGLFKEKGCAGCHQGKLALEKLLTTGTVTDFAVAMWNHAPAMVAESKKSGKPLPKLEPAEMQELVSYLWDSVLFSEQGNAARGEKAFARKNCTACHGEKSSGAPDLKEWLMQRGDPIRPFSIMSVLWQHGPAMLQGMKAKHVAWPNFSQNEMLDMIAYLNSLGSKPGAKGE